MQDLLYRNMYVVGKNGVVVLSPDTILQGESLFDPDHMKPDAMYVFSNMKPGSTAIPFVLIGSRFAGQYKYDEVVAAVEGVIDAMLIRELLKDSVRGDDDYQRMILEDLNVDAFRMRMNGPLTKDARKQLYKCMTATHALINIDGLLFTILRRNGNVTFEYCEAKDEERTYYASPGVQRPELFFKGRSNTELAVNLNCKKYESIENVVFQGWPEAIIPTLMESYTGRVKAQAIDDLSKPNETTPT